jgi:heptosyltransferase-1
MNRAESPTTTDQRLSTTISILIVRLGAIGDVVHTLPALGVLRRSFPEARIAWAVEPGGAAQLLKRTPMLDELIEVDLRGMRRAIVRNRGEIWRLRQRLGGFDLAIDFQGLIKSGALPWMAGVRRRIGFDYPALRERASGLLMTERVTADDTGHIIEKNLPLIRHLGCVADGPYEFPIEVGAEAEDFARRMVEQTGGPFAILNPGGGWPTKLWAPQNYGLLADRLHEEYGIVSLITYGPGERALAEAAAQASRASRATPIESTLPEFMALSQRSALFVGGDTGPMHLATAVQTPVVAIFGPSSARRNGPFDPDDVVVERTDLECRVDCYRRKCDHCSCLKLELDPVWEGVRRRLKRVI